MHVVQSLYEVRLSFGFGSIETVQSPPHDRKKHTNHGSYCAGKQQHHEGQCPRQKYEDADEYWKKGRIEKGLKKLASQELADIFSQLHVANQDTRSRRFKNRQGEVKKAGKSASADLCVDLATRDLHQTLSDVAEARIEACHEDKDAEEGQKRVPSLMRNDAVNHDLEQEGHREGNQISEDGRDSDACQKASL